MCPMSLTFLQKAGPSSGHGNPQTSGLSTDSSQAPAAARSASGAPADVLGSHQERNLVGPLR